MRQLHERNPDNSLVAKNYLITIYSGFYEGVRYSGLIPDPYFSKAEEIQNRYEFNKEDLNHLEFVRSYALFQYKEATNADQALKAFERIWEICEEEKSLYYTSLALSFFELIYRK